MEDLEAQLQIFRKIDLLHNEALFESFAGVFNGWGQSGPDFYAHMHNENRYFEKSDYYYTGSLEFFHLTSIDNLWSILNSRSFRLYNLHSSKDPDEYAHAAKVLQLSDFDINIKKKFSYTFSFCPISEMENKSVWEIYGDRFKGVAIVFSIENNPISWKNFHMAEVKYGDPVNFHSYRKRVKEIELEYRGINLSCDLSRLICFHKTAKWKGEREVRIATYNPFQQLEEYWKYSK